MHSDFEFHIIPEGKGYITLEGRDFEVNAGEFYITGPMICHRQKTDTEKPMSEGIRLSKSADMSPREFSG